jgi:SHS2 domain-containing protein
MDEPRASAGFVELDHTADRAIRVWAPSPAELFAQAARGMFALLADFTAEAAVSRYELVIEMDDLETALVDWLNELLYWHETRHEIYGEFTLLFEEGQLRARFAGQPAGGLRAVVKAATFHDLAIRQDQSGVWQTVVVFDT